MKKKITLYILILSSIFISSCKSKYSEEIEKSCKDCNEIKIPKSNFILVTNQSGQSNVFNKNSMVFILSKWYPAKFNEGFIIDDITFSVDGKEIMCSEGFYNILSDKYLEGNMGNEAPSSTSSSSSSSSGSSSSYESKACSWCGKSFSGTHYTHLGKMADCQSSTSSNSIGTYCSMKCCSEARRSSCPTCR